MLTTTINKSNMSNILSLRQQRISRNINTDLKSIHRIYALFKGALIRKKFNTNVEKIHSHYLHRIQYLHKKINDQSKEHKRELMDLSQTHSNKMYEYKYQIEQELNELHQEEIFYIEKKHSTIIQQLEQKIKQLQELS
tara:strand:- start:293 stop:706 length:414 start_codon:yes stop_codon:yes gene_type:complete